MKYFVMVNGKYMTSVEVDGSACAAEHVVLDGICHGVESAQAFTQAEMKCDFFINSMMACELITLDELKRKSADASSRFEDDLRTINQRIGYVSDDIKWLIENMPVAKERIDAMRAWLNYLIESKSRLLMCSGEPI